MIFITVGTDLPFDRMMRVVDAWARENKRKDLFAQIGEGGWKPEFIPSAEFLEPPAFREKFTAASLIIGHAGMGTILSALHHGKPILVMPKKASLGEQRNEHQMATARNMQALGHVTVAFDEAELRQKLDQLDRLTSKPPISPFADAALTSGLHDFIFNG